MQYLVIMKVFRKLMGVHIDKVGEPKRKLLLFKRVDPGLGCHFQYRPCRSWLSFIYHTKKLRFFLIRSEIFLWWKETSPLRIVELGCQIMGAVIQINNIVQSFCNFVQRRNISFIKIKLLEWIIIRIILYHDLTYTYTNNDNISV